jgi:hypothetical protein
MTKLLLLVNFVAGGSSDYTMTKLLLLVNFVAGGSSVMLSSLAFFLFMGLARSRS